MTFEDPVINLINTAHLNRKKSSEMISKLKETREKLVSTEGWKNAKLVN